MLALKTLKIVADKKTFLMAILIKLTFDNIFIQMKKIVFFFNFESLLKIVQFLLNLSAPNL